MKHMKKLVAMLVSVLMGFAMMTTVFADGNSLTVKNTGATDHTFEVYQVFKGDISNGTLSNVKWGNGVTTEGQTALGDASAKAETLKQAEDAKAFADELVASNYLTNATTHKVTAGESYTFNLDAGYYLVKDTADSQTGNNSAYTAYIMQVVGSARVETKLDVPTVEKKVKDKNDSTGETTGWQDSADYDIGDSVPYQITGTMPSNIGDYKTYSYAFTDTMSKGLTYTAKTATVKIDGKDVTGTDSFKETVTANENGSTTVTWACTDLKAIPGVTINAKTKVVVTYNATLNDSAVLGSAGNPNEVYLTFSNNPNKGGEDNTGKTPTDKNIVFTYKTVVNKVDQDEKTPLKGAGFTLQKKQSDETYKPVKTFTAGDQTTFEFKGLDDGDYKLIESTTPAGYNTITPVAFTISATHDTTADDPKLLTLSGDVTSGSAKFTADTNAGSLTTNVVNKKGSVLPSTGGVGTTMFYVAGGLMVVVAGVLLAAKKKAEAK